MKSQSPLLYLALACLSLALSPTRSSAQFTDLWLIGVDDSSQAEFEHENDGDDFFYVEDGDYTGSNPAGELWNSGPESWNDGTPANAIGFERALTAGDPIMHIYFQLDADEADAGTNFNFEADFIQGEDPSSHDLEFRLNGVTFHSQTGVSTDGGAEVLVTDTFMGVDVGTVEGSNVLTIERIGGTGAWVQLDYVRLQADVSTGSCADPICSFAGGPLNLAPGGSSTLRWITDPTASLSIDQGIGNVDANTSSGIGSIAVSPTETTTYTLTSTRGGDVETAQVTITVSNIISFVADPFQVLPNGNVNLNWEVDPAASVSIDQGIGNVDGDTVAGIGSIVINPDATMTYTLTSTRGADVETAMVTVTVNTFTRLWIIGDNDGDQDEFEVESQGDDFFYVEDGDYTGLNPAGALWTSGPEPWSVPLDDDLGFERALSTGDPDTNIYFQLNSGQANAGTTFLLNAEFADAEAGSTHDLEFRMNGTTFHTEAGLVADGATETLVSPVFTGDDVNTADGSNVLTIARTGGTGAWVQFDYVELKADLSTANCDEPICSFAGTPTTIAPGESSDLIWAIDPTATASLDQGIGNVDASTTNGVGSVPIAPIQNTTYTLTSTRGMDTDSQQVTITVRNIISFAGAPAIARPGIPTTLSWQVDPAASVTIDNGIGNVDGQTVAGVGSIDVTPTETTTYTLTSTRGADVEQRNFTVVFVDLALLWQIGVDNNDQNEFEAEFDADDFFYLEDGDYTGTSPDGGFIFGALWSAGREPENDGVGGNEIGFERALTEGDPDTHIFFQLDPEEASPDSQFTFTVEMRAAQDPSTHDLEFRMNGNIFHSVDEVNAVGNNQVLITDTFSGEDVEAQAGPNVLTVARTAGTGAWIQMDYLTLEVQAVAPAEFKITDIRLDDGDVIITWNSRPGRNYVLDSSPDMKTWLEVEDSIASMGSSTSYTESGAAAGTGRRYYRVIER